MNEGNSSHFGPDTFQIVQCKENSIPLGVGSHKSLVELIGQNY